MFMRSNDAELLRSLVGMDVCEAFSKEAMVVPRGQWVNKLFGTRANDVAVL
jgi:hypothetical protein